MRIWGFEDLRIWCHEDLRIWGFGAMRLRLRLWNLGQRIFLISFFISVALETWGFEDLRIWGFGAMRIWGFGAMRIWGFGVNSSKHDEIAIKTWWNWGQNMMKLGSKHGEIHILCTTTFCALSVPNIGHFGHIVSLCPVFGHIYFHPMGMLYCCHVTGKLTPRPV